MKRQLIALAIFHFALSIFHSACAAPLDRIQKDFQVPPQVYGVNCWWWWLNGNVDAAAIRKDLAAMKSKGFQGAMIFDAGGYDQGGHAKIPAGPKFGSPEWCDLFALALDEAEKHGLEMGFNIQSGWNLGGPSVKPEHAAKRLVYSSAMVADGQQEIVLPQPKSDPRFYRDVAVLAFPVDPKKMSVPINALDAKLSLHEMGGSATDCRFLLGNKGGGLRKGQEKQSYLVAKREVVDVTAQLGKDGRLQWRPPVAGGGGTPPLPGGSRSVATASESWMVMRIGYTLTGSKVSTCSDTWGGLTLDYMSRPAFETYWNEVVEPIFERVRRHVGKTLKYMETDSWECGGMNWTDDFAASFERLHGYSPIPYLPVISGAVVDDLNASHAFLADFRKTIATLIFENHYSEFSRKAHANNMGIQPESAGPHAGPLDGIRNYSASDIVMSEFWALSPHRPRPENRFFVKQASSVAHVYGKRIVGAESFTTIGPQWNDAIGTNQKRAFDHEICSGFNRTYFHTFTCSPPSMGLPGQEYFAGTHMNPQLTWWNESDTYIRYLSRVQAVVQNGRFVPDALYYYGDHVPNIYPLKEKDMAGVLPDYDYDVIDEQGLLLLKVTKDGLIQVPSGLTYRILVLPNHDVLSPKAMAQLDQLLDQGAKIVGPSPTAPRCITHDAGQRKMNWKHRNLFAGKNGAAVLRELGVKPNFTVEGTDRKNLDFIHYTVDGADVYFVCNQALEVVEATCGFRSTQGQPELWNPMDGSVRTLPVAKVVDGRTLVPLRFDPAEAYFVVFREGRAPARPRRSRGDRPTDGGRTRGSASLPGEANFPKLTEALTVEGPWRVKFDTAKGGPKEVVFPKLQDWTAREDVRYYSGAATYHAKFEAPASGTKRRAYLELRSVKDVGIAEVTLNGRKFPAVWAPPFRVEVTDALKSGANELDVKMVNSWYNRVLGDQLGATPTKLTQTNIRIVQKNRRPKPEPSGLLGPVVLLCESDER